MNKKYIVFMFLLNLKAFSITDEVIEEIKYKNFALKFGYREWELSNEEKIVPIYSNFKYYLKPIKNFKPFFMGGTGFNYIEENEDDIDEVLKNNYYSVGAGISIRDFSIGVAYINYNVMFEDSMEEVSEDRFLLEIKYRY